MNNPNVALITINYNQAKMTIDCIKSIISTTYDNFKIYLVDNGSKDENYKILLQNKDLGFNLIRLKENCGYVGGVNAGLMAASLENPDFFLIMNNDTIIDKNAMTALVKTGLKNEYNAIISGKVYDFNEPDVLQYVGGMLKNKKYLTMYQLNENEVDIGQCDQECERDMLDDIFWLIPNQIYKSIGLYSNNYFLYAEQADYARQAVKKGFKLIYTPKAKIWHKGSVTTGDGNKYSAPVNFWRNKGWVIYLYRNTKKRDFWLILSKVFVKSIVKNFLNFLNLRNSSDERSEYAALIGVVYGLQWVVNQKPDNGYNPFIK